jgi:prophage DNA circulation protein
MAFWPQIRQASLGGLTLGVSRASHDERRSLVTFRYPHRDGVEREDLGNAGGRIALTVELLDQAGYTAQQQLRSLQALMHQAALVRYSDPHLGDFPAVRVSSVRADLELSPDHIQASVELEEEADDSPAFAAEQVGVAAAVGRIDAAIAAAKVELGALA